MSRKLYALMCHCVMRQCHQGGLSQQHTSLNSWGRFLINAKTERQTSGTIRVQSFTRHAHTQTQKTITMGNRHAAVSVLTEVSFTEWQQSKKNDLMQEAQPPHPPKKIKFQQNQMNWCHFTDISETVSSCLWGKGQGAAAFRWEVKDHVTNIHEAWVVKNMNKWTQKCIHPHEEKQKRKKNKCHSQLPEWQVEPADKMFDEHSHRRKLLQYGV